jgi:uroporphyrinogen-III synthase
MAVLVTRPSPDNEATASALRARGYKVLLAPMLRFEPLGLRDDDRDAEYGAVIVTSANALRAIEPQLKGSHLLKLPLFAVGEHSAAAARAAGFDQVISADGEAAALRDRVLESVRAKQLKKKRALLYLAGHDLSRDLAGELSERGFNVVTATTYRMVPLANLPSESRDAFATNGIEAVLHYSRRSGRAFVEAVRAGGVEISALAVPQCCISANVAAIFREAGATGVTVASSPDENALFGALERALRTGLA